MVSIGLSFVWWLIPQGHPCQFGIHWANLTFWVSPRKQHLHDLHVRQLTCGSFWSYPGIAKYCLPVAQLGKPVSSEASAAPSHQGSLPLQGLSGWLKAPLHLSNAASHTNLRATAKVDDNYSPHNIKRETPKGVPPKEIPPMGANISKMSHTSKTVLPDITASALYLAEGFLAASHGDLKP